MRTLGFGQCLEPVGDFVEAFTARGFGHAGIHVGVLVGLAGDGCLEIVTRAANGQACCRIAHDFHVFKMTVSMAGLAFRGGAKHGGDIVLAFYISLPCEIQIATIRLRFAGKCVFQILMSLAAF